MTSEFSISEFSISTLGQIGVTIRNLAAAVDFYRDKLRIPLLFQAPNMAFFDCGGVRMMLGPPEGTKGGYTQMAGNSILYFKVDDIHAATKTLKSRGVAFERDPHLVAKMPDHDLWLAFFRDLEDNVLALMCEMKR
jgi:methylmalonyl-CoA/ethylmalonyl-CoA epimerase